MMSKYEILNTRTVFKGSVIDVTESEVRLPNGREAKRLTVTHPGAVVILPQQQDGSLLLIRQYRHALLGTLLEFPAGTLEPGESPAHCARREIIEEVGFAADDWINLGELYPAPGFCNEIQHLFFARGLYPAQAEADEDEIIETCTMTIAEVERAIVSGDLRDAKSIAIFTHARLNGLL